MNARYYVPYIYRMVSADTIVPDPTNPQSFNRYSYVLNNPVNYADPDGHNPMWCNDPYDGGGGAECSPMVAFTGDLEWAPSEKAKVLAGAFIMDYALSRHGSNFSAVYGGTVTFEKRSSAGSLGWADKENHIYVNINDDNPSITSPTTGSMWAAHELSHGFNYELHPNTTDNLNYGQGIIDLALEGVFADGIRIAGNIKGMYAVDVDPNTKEVYYMRSPEGYRTGINPGGTGPYQQNPTAAVNEDFADMVMNWAFNSFDTNTAGTERYNFVDSHMSTWINLAVTNN